MAIGKGGTTAKRTKRPDGWSKLVRARFLDAFAATFSVTAAAASVGRTPNSFYALKRRDPQFAQAYHDAIVNGYERLEAELLARALGQGRGDTTQAGDVARGTNRRPASRAAEMISADGGSPFDAALAIKILQMRQGETGRGNDRRSKTFARVTQADTDAELMRKLAAAERRLKLAASEMATPTGTGTDD